MLKGLELLVSLVGDCFCTVRREAEVGTSVLRLGRCHPARCWLHIFIGWSAVRRSEKSAFAPIYSTAWEFHVVVTILSDPNPISWLSGVALSLLHCTSDERPPVMYGHFCMVLRLGRCHRAL